MLTYFTTFTANALFIDFFWASLFLFLAQMIRIKVKFLQDLFLPASAIAGIAGMLLSKEFANIIVFSDQLSWYPSILVNMLFATLMIGYIKKTESFGKAIWKVRDTFYAATLNGVMQFGFSILVGYFLCKTFFTTVNPTVGILLPAGFYGGYGYAGAIGSVLEKYGFVNAPGIGMTFATLGMFAGIIGGMIYINIAARKGYTKHTKKLSEIPREMRTGLLNGDAQFSTGTATMNPNAIDPVGFHWCLVFTATGLGWLGNYYLNKYTGLNVPILALAMLFGLAIQSILNAAKLGEYVDKKTITRIGSTVTDYMVFFGFCSIRKAIIMDYWGIILALFLFGISFTAFSMWFMSPRIFRSSWFEKGIFFYGFFTGIMATGVTLLRVVDPENKSGLLADFGIANIPFAYIDLFQISMYPIFLGMGFIWQTGLGIVAAGFVLMIIMFKTGCLHRAYYKGGEFESLAENQ